MEQKRGHRTILFSAGLATLLFWVTPLLRPFALPLVLYNTHLHELSHALAAVATGGQVRHILVFANGSGVTPVAGGSPLIVASAGYVGAALIGGIFIASGRSGRSARNALWAAFGFLAFSLLFFIRGDLIGILSAVFWMGVLGALAKWAKPATAAFAVQFLGLQQALTSLHALLELYSLTSTSEAHSDAQILAEITGVPSVAWAGLWLVLGVIAVLAGLVTAWKENAPGPASSRSKSSYLG
ncbi:MAG: M50 family metallopeptidase [Fimbriimonadaceae bacterium]|nr:M50 family metallopeptidase [Fimbriimonadaceae bacterium]QYK56344.1 MAG: M50 family metallopeptidase [Fimbriimonadaceae bacterium]